MVRDTHALMERRPEALAFGIVGAGRRPEDKAMHDSLVPQDSLYTLVERIGDRETASVIGSLAAALRPYPLVVCAV